MTDAYDVPPGEALDRWMEARAETNQFFNHPPGPQPGISREWAQELANLLEKEHRWRNVYVEFAAGGSPEGFPAPNLDD